MELEVLRFSSQSDSTSGLLFENSSVGKKFLCYCLEDERRALKVKGETRVPAGTYKRIYPAIAKAIELNEEVTITYIDYD